MYEYEYEWRSIIHGPLYLLVITYVMQPGQLSPRRIGLYVALEIDIVALLDVVDDERWAES